MIKPTSNPTCGLVSPMMNHLDEDVVVPPKKPKQQYYSIPKTNWSNLDLKDATRWVYNWGVDITRVAPQDMLFLCVHRTVVRASICTLHKKQHTTDTTRSNMNYEWILDKLQLEMYWLNGSKCYCTVCIHAPYVPSTPRKLRVCALTHSHTNVSMCNRHP